MVEAFSGTGLIEATGGIGTPRVVTSNTEEYNDSNSPLTVLRRM